MQMQTPKISIIVSTYNWSEALDMVLSALVLQVLKYPNVEIIIADDGSLNTTASVINKYLDKIPNQLKHIWHEDIGFRKAMILNKAVANSNGEYLLFLDGDCVPFPDYLSEHIKLIEKGFFVSGGRVLLSKDFSEELFKDIKKLQNIYNWGAIDWLIARFSRKVNKFFPWLRFGSQWWRYIRSTNWQYPKGCNFAMWRKDFMLVNGFDEEYNGWGHEDADLFIRLLHAGIKIKNGRFAVSVLHLWHKEADRKLAEKNWNRLIERLADYNFTKANIGINQY